MAIGAAVASVAVGAMNYSSAKSAQKSSERAQANANRLAAEQHAYSQEMMGNYQSWAGQNALNVAGQSWGGNYATAHMYSAQTYDAQLAGNASLVGPGGGAVGDNQIGIDTAQSMLDDWEATFGGIEDNLTDYYTNLDPNKFAIQSKADLQANLEKSMQQFNETMAASGLQSAGMKQQAAKEAAFAQAQGNSQIDIFADETVAQMQQGFLNYGSPYKQQAQSLLAGASNLDAQLRQNTEVANMASRDASDMFNANAENQREEFNIMNLNQAGMFNAGAINDANRSNAASATQVGMYNAGVANQAQSMKNNAINSANALYGNSWLQMANLSNPMIARADNEAQLYGQSQAGYSAAAGSAFGTAMQLGVTAYNQ